MIPLILKDFRQMAAIALCVLFASLTFSTALVEITFGAALVFWLLLRIQTKRLIPQSIPAYAWPLAGFVLWCALSILWSEARPQSIRGFFKIAQQVMLFWMAAELLRGSSRRRFANVFLIVLAVVVFDGLIQYFFGRDFIRGFAPPHSSAGFRITASFKTYGLLATWLIMTLPFLLFLGLRWRNHERSAPQWYLTMPVFTFGLLILILTRSRGAFLALVCGTFLMLIAHRKFIWIALFSVLVCATVALLPHAMVIHLDITNKEQSIVERLSLWNRAWDVVAARPVTGTGINTYAAVHERYDKTKDWRVRGYYAHNGYLQVAAETGMTGLGLFLLFLVLFLRHTILKIKRRPNLWDRAAGYGLLAGIFNFLLLTAVDTVMHNQQSVMAFWFLLGTLNSYAEDGLPHG